MTIRCVIGLHSWLEYSYSKTKGYRARICMRCGKWQGRGPLTRFWSSKFDKTIPRAKARARRGKSKS